MTTTTPTAPVAPVARGGRRSRRANGADPLLDQAPSASVAERIRLIARDGAPISDAGAAPAADTAAPDDAAPLDLSAAESDALIEARGHGYDARRDGAPIEANPHGESAEPDAWTAWRGGWLRREREELNLDAPQEAASTPDASREAENLEVSRDSGPVRYDVGPDGTVSNVERLPLPELPETDGARFPAGHFDLFDGIPSDTLFEDEDDAEFLKSHQLRAIGERLIEGLPEFKRLVDRDVRYYWRRNGGTPNNQPALGGMTRAAGLLRQTLDGADWVLWLAADHLRDVRPTKRQIEAAVYHQLCHADETAKGKTTTRPHQFEGFVPELQRYGAWNQGLLKMLGAIGKRADPAGTQLSFSLDESGGGGDDLNGGLATPEAADGEPATQFDMGAAAYATRTPIDANPYPAGTPKADAWDHGWLEAANRADETQSDTTTPNVAGDVVEPDGAQAAVRALADEFGAEVTVRGIDREGTEIARLGAVPGTAGRDED